MQTSSNDFINYLQHEIKSHGGFISFATFMAAALYHPQYGYYNSNEFTLGKHGDFTTAPEISPLFAYCFATQCHQIMEHIGTCRILEYGAGTGQFAYDLLTELNRLNKLPTEYYIIEISPNLRAKQKTFLQQHASHFFDRIIWRDELPADFKGIIIANEVLDALPIHCFCLTDNGIQEKCVTYQHEQLSWQITPPTTPLLLKKATQLKEQYALTPGYESEVNLALEPLIANIAASLREGVILFTDYGYGEREYYHPQRQHGTLTCFYQHTKHNNPFLHPSREDITAHVNFTDVAEFASTYGLDLLGYTHQSAFLFALSLMDKLAHIEKNLSEKERVNLHHAIKILTFPTEMGERIKVMALGKNINFSLLGMSLQDRRRDL